jgi:hypothetical protein
MEQAGIDPAVYHSASLDFIYDGQESWQVRTKPQTRFSIGGRRAISPQARAFLKTRSSLQSKFVSEGHRPRRGGEVRIGAMVF